MMKLFERTSFLLLVDRDRVADDETKENCLRSIAILSRDD